MNKYTEISDLLRDFMEDDRKCCGDSDRNADQITCTDDQSINQIMNHISDEIHESKRMFVLLGDRHMTVIPTDDFFCDQSENNTSQNTDGRNEHPS